MSKATQAVTFQKLSEDDWEQLLERIAEQRCTPFLGTEVSVPTAPAASEIARRWAEKHEYPLPDVCDLPRVAQYYAAKKNDSERPKETIQRLLKAVKPPAV